MFSRTTGLVVTAVFVAALAQSALGADLPNRPVYKAPAVAPVPVQTWTGCYVGGNGGYGWSQKSWYDYDPYTSQGSSSSTGGVAGGQIGCDYQTGAFVFGVQGMWDWADLDGSHPYSSDPKYIDHSEISWFATLTGRVGYAVQPTSLLYIKGGAAWVRDKFTETCPAGYSSTYACPGEDKVTRVGWTVGGGWEYRFAPNWSAFVEYNYMDFGKDKSTLAYTNSSTYDYDIKQNMQTVLVGINYRFSSFATGW
jgi:outer membrane immunogenic protein